ncbi:MAG: FTR1 family protein [Methylococcales bacterium]|nr:FTR1 family protein [Methylococcales bacterium]
MDTFLQATIMSFREGLEGFLIVTLLLKFLDKTDNTPLKKQVWHGVFAGILTSIILGLILTSISSYIGGLKTTAKLWESVGGIIAVILVTTFVIWMIQHGSKIKDHLELKAAEHLTSRGVMLLSLFMIAREGTEIAIFSFAGKYSVTPIILGLSISIVLVLLINYSLIRVNLKTIFVITLAYLVIQAGYLFGYSLHEGLSAAKNLGWLQADNPIFSQAFNLSKTVFNHKNGMFGLPLNVTLGWYSKPEWIQLIMQYSYTFLLFSYWHKRKD